MVRFSNHYKRQIITSSTKRYNDYNECLNLLGWGSCREIFHSRDMIRGSAKPAQTAQLYLELEAVFQTLKHLFPSLKDQNIPVRCDNLTLVHCINKQGGTKSPHLYYRTWNVWKFGIQNNIHIKTLHILGVQTSE